MGLFGGGGSETGADAPPSSKPESALTNKYPSELLEAFDVSESFMQEVSAEFQQKEVELEKARQNGTRAFKFLMNGTPQTELLLGTEKHSLLKEVHQPQDYPDVVARTWNTTSEIPTNEHNLDQLKSHLGSFAYEAVHNRDFETAAKTLTILSGNRPAWENDELMTPIRQMLVSEGAEHARLTKFQLIEALNTASQNPNKIYLKSLEEKSSGQVDRAESEVKTENPSITQTEDSAPDAPLENPFAKPTQVITEETLIPSPTETPKYLRKVPEPPTPAGDILNNESNVPTPTINLDQSDSTESPPTPTPSPTSALAGNKS